jgi:hypothetical protein
VAFICHLPAEASDQRTGENGPVRSQAGVAAFLVVFLFAALALVACPSDEEGPQASGDETPSPAGSVKSPESPSPARKPKGGDKPDEKPSPPRDDAPRGFEIVATKAWTRCTAGPPLKGACPTIVPKVKRHYLVESFGKPGGRFGVLELSAGAPRDAPEANAPPGFAHVVLEAGGPRFLIDFGAPAATATLSDTLLQQSRSGAVLLGAREWGDRSGRLLLAEPFPGGGAHGDHLVFEWRRGGVIHRISLHAWVPVAKAESALKKIVVSMR